MVVDQKPVSPGLLGFAPAALVWDLDFGPESHSGDTLVVCLGVLAQKQLCLFFLPEILLNTGAQDFHKYDKIFCTIWLIVSILNLVEHNFNREHINYLTVKAWWCPRDSTSLATLKIPKGADESQQWISANAKHFHFLPNQTAGGLWMCMCVRGVVLSDMRVSQMYSDRWDGENTLDSGRTLLLSLSSPFFSFSSFFSNVSFILHITWWPRFPPLLLLSPPVSVSLSFSLMSICFPSVLTHFSNQHGYSCGCDVCIQDIGWGVGKCEYNWYLKHLF